METSLEVAIDEFFLARKPKKHSEHTLDAYRRDLTTITSQLTAIFEKPSTEIKVGEIGVPSLRKAFANIAHHSASTIARTWSTWNQLFTFLVAEQILEGNPMAAVQKPTIARSRPKSIGGNDSVDRLIKAAAKGRTGARKPWPERDLAIVAVLITCGLRLTELLDLTLNSIDGLPGERVLGVRGKGRKERTVPLEPEVEALVNTYQSSRQNRFSKKPAAKDALFVNDKNQPLKRGGLQYMIDRLYREAGIRTKVPSGALVHALRHTFATNLARNGASGTELQHLLGHESLATTQRYIDVTAREIRAAARSNEAYKSLNDLSDQNKPGK